MFDDLTALIQSLMPEDGSSIGNGAMMALLRDHVPGLSDEDYAAARDVLVDEGVIGRGRGRGGSIYRANLTDLTLEIREADETAPPRANAKAKGKASGVTRLSAGEPLQVLSYRHGETRVNNPEVGMVHAGTDPDGARTTWAYDPHLDPVLNFDSARAGLEKLIDDALASGDPQAMKDALIELKRLQAPYLTWTGKAERTSFEVDTVSLHVHERVDPATILAHAAKRLKGKDAGSQWRQADLFAAPFENLPLRQALDFYSHEKGWSNRLVSGDSLLVMNSLLTKESMGGKVQMIYIDPPYGIKYGSNFQPFTNKRNVEDKDVDLTQEPEMIKAFRDTWELGIHSYLSYLRDRLILSRDLLHESGSVFMQIGEENQHLIKCMMDEIFGTQNYVTTIVFAKTVGSTAEFVGGTYDLLLWYARDKTHLKYRQLFTEKQPGGDGASAYTRIELPNGDRRTMTKAERKDASVASKVGTIITYGDLTSARVREGQSGYFAVPIFGREIFPPKREWSTHRIGIDRLLKVNRITEVGPENVGYVRRLLDFPVTPQTNLWSDTMGQNQYGGEKTYVVQTQVSVVQRCLLMTTDPGDLVLDPTCGSGTTAFVAEKWGRRWITCDTSRVAITLAKQRLMTTSFDYYALR
jgi:adenine-specific DNA-methyltransferase